MKRTATIVLFAALLSSGAQAGDAGAVRQADAHGHAMDGASLRATDEETFNEHVSRLALRAAIKDQDSLSPQEKLSLLLVFSAARESPHGR
jgi:hypothetical protein